MSTQLDWPIIPPSILSGIVRIGQREGTDVALWFAGTEVDYRRLVAADSPSVSYRQAITILRRAVRDLPNRPLGMEVGTRDLLLTMGMVGVAMRSCATVGEALSVGLDFHLTAGSLLDITLEQYGDETALRFHERSHEPELLTFLCEEALCSATVFARSLIGERWSPTRVELGYPAPSYAREYGLLLRCPIQFSTEANRVCFPSSMLAQPLSTHCESIKTLAIDVCRRMLGLGRAADITMAVETVLERDLPRQLSMADVAARLHVSERTLRRQLALAGENFSAIRDRVRQRRAMYILRESALSIAAVAREVGYKDIRDFRRAYIRWTGHVPSAERRISGQPNTIPAPGSSVPA